MGLDGFEGSGVSLLAKRGCTGHSRVRNCRITFNLYCYQPWEPQNVLATYAVTIDVSPMPPALSLNLSGDNVLIAWPTNNSSGFFLEGATSLQPAQWAALNVMPQVGGRNYWVTLGRSGSALYFRLHKL